MARRLEVAIVGDASQFLREMKGAESRTQKFGRAAGIAGTAIVGGLAVGMKKSVDAAREAQVCRRSRGVMVCRLPRLTAAENHPPLDFGRGK